MGFRRRGMRSGEEMARGALPGAARRPGAENSSNRTAIVDQFARAENPDAAFAAFDRFLERTTRRRPISFAVAAKSRTDPLCRADPRRLRRVLPVFSRKILTSSIRWSIRVSSAPCRTRTRLETALARALEDTQGYEAVLDAIRQFGQEHMFLIGARILSGSVSAEQAGELFATPCRRTAARRASPGARTILPQRTAASAGNGAPSSRSAASAPAR